MVASLFLAAIVVNCGTCVTAPGCLPQLRRTGFSRSKNRSNAGRYVDGFPLRDEPILPRCAKLHTRTFELLDRLIVSFSLATLLEMPAPAARVGELLCLKFAAIHARLTND